ncbi:MAG: ATP-binding cassette domain-containing protein, partial [Planctomycetaceae bacterium]
MTSMISLQNVTRLYGTVLGVNDITLELPKGAYGLLGPNGAGKSTLLNLLIGQLRPTRGRVEVLGMPPRNNP